MSYLWLTRWAPFKPLKGGDIDYSRELMTHLAAFEPLKALVFASPGVDPPAVPGVTWQVIEAREPSKLASVASPLPNVAFRHRSRAYLDAALAQPAEAIFVDFIGMFWIVKPLVAALEAKLGARRPQVIVINHNVEQDVRQQMVVNAESIVMRLALGLDAAKAGRLEREANAVADGLAANTAADQAVFAQRVATPSVVITPGYAGTRAPPRTIGPDTPPRIAIVGGHQGQHKRMVLDLTLAALTRHGVEKACIVDVVGSGDSTPFKAKYPGVNFYGFVDDIASYFQTVRFGLIPDEIGGGFKHRALTHAFQQTPMLALHKALAGMGLVAEEHYVGAETLDDLAAAIPGLLNDFDRLNRIREQAFAHCENAYDWSERGRDLHAFAQSLKKAAA